MPVWVKRTVIIVGLLAVFVLVVVLSWHNRQAWFGYDIYRVESVSMLPTLKPNDIVIVKLFSSGATAVHKNDIVVLFNPNDEHSKLIKRIAYLPSETATFVQTSTQLDAKTRRPVTTRKRLTLDNIQGYFVLGDNPKHSTDSRDFGVISADELVGRVVYHVTL